jgi:uncharacterized protein YggE
MSDQKTSNKKQMLALNLGIFAIGMVAASIVGGQMLSARGQTEEAGAISTSVDLDCEPEAEICEQQILEEHIKSVVSTSGTAMVKVNPDKISVTIGVDTDGETAKEAAAKNAELMEKVLAALRELGISDQISTSWYNVFPVYEHRSPPCIEIYPQPPECAPKSELTGYRAHNSVTVTLDADENVGEVIDAAVAAGTTNVSGAYFFISEETQQEIRDSLIADAIDNARSRAEKAADAVSMDISGVKSIHLNDVYFPVLYKELAAQVDASGASTTPILPGEQSISMTVQVVFFMS